MLTVEERQDYQEIVRDLAKVIKSLSDLNRLMRDRDYWYFGTEDTK